MRERERRVNFDQQVRIFDPARAKPVTVIGIGSVGSQLALTLAKEGCADITIWDGDEVASHNIPMSEYRISDLMCPKTYALTEIVEAATGTRIVANRRMYDGAPLKNSVVACVDTMEARQLIWSKVKQNPFVDIFVDTRTAEEYIEVFAIRPCQPEDIEYYEHFLYPSAMANRAMCGLHGAKHISGTAANAACAALTEWWQSLTTKRHLRMLCGHFQEV